MALVRRGLACLAASVLAAGALAAVTPGAAQAAPLICDPGEAVYTTSTESTYLYIKPGNSLVYSASSTAPLTITSDFERTVSVGASYTASVGGNLGISVPVRGFNIAAGIEGSAEAAMDVTLGFTRKVTANVTIPAGHSMLEYVGHRMTQATVTKKLCNSSGTAFLTSWSGRLTGPRLAAYGWIDCRDTTYC